MELIMFCIVTGLGVVFVLLTWMFRVRRPSPTPGAPTTPPVSVRRRIRDWPWKWILGIPIVLAVIGSIVYFLPQITPLVGSTSSWFGSLGMAVWFYVAGIVILGLILYFYRLRGLWVTILVLLAPAAIWTAWYIGSSAGMPAILWPTDWSNQHELHQLFVGMKMPAILTAIVLLGVVIPLCFLIGWGRTERGLRKGGKWLGIGLLYIIGFGAIGFTVYLGLIGQVLAAMVGISALVIISVVFGNKGWTIISLLFACWIGQMAWVKYTKHKKRFDTAVAARSSSKKYSAKEMKELQRDSRHGIQLFRCSFLPIDGDEWWTDTGNKTLPEDWDYYGGHLSFTIHWQYGQTIFVDVFNTPGGIAKGTWTWYENGGVKILAKGSAILATPVPDPTAGPEVGGSLLMVPHKRWNDSELVGVLQFVLRFPETLPRYQAEVERRL